MKENKFLEFKSEITNTFLKTVSAFANFNDGEIVFGITDHGDVCGVADPVQSCLDIENRINDSISPKPNFTLQIAKDETIHLDRIQRPAYTVSLQGQGLSPQRYRHDRG